MDKSENISLEELRRVTLPDKKKKEVKIDIISYYICRPICDYLTIRLLNTPVSANTVTKVSFFSAIASFVLIYLIPNKIGAILGFLLIFVWNIADGIDGSIARFRGTVSKSGDLWDATAGYMALVSFYMGSGLIAAYETSTYLLPFLTSREYAFFGGVSAIAIIFPRLISQKKSVVYGPKSVSSLQNKSGYSLIKKIMLNIVSINGFAAMLLLLCILFNTVNFFVLFYLVINIAFFCSTMFRLLKNLK